MRRTLWRAVSLAVPVLGLALMSCDGPNRGSNTQPSSASGFTVYLTASPNTVRGPLPEGDSQFGGCSQVQAKVVDPQGNLVDGATVLFTTDLGIFRRGTESFVGLFEETTRGFATVGWCSQNERGTATITASVEDAYVTTQITIL